MITATFEEITPEIAADMLGRMRRNRPVRDRQVAKITRDIKAGRWHLNGDSVKIGADGRLIDGQHRLLAIVNSDITVLTLVVRGVEPDAHHTIDTGLSRKFGDILAMDGQSEAQMLAALARRLWFWEQGIYMYHHVTLVPSNPELDEFMEKNLDEFVNAITWARPVYRDARITPTSLAAIKVILDRSGNADKATAFLDGWVTGIDLEAGSPVLTLRRRFARADDMHSQGGAVTQPDRWAFAFTAWNAYVDGKTYDSKHTLSQPKGGFTNRNFPVPE